MARKFELISDLFDRTCSTVAANPESWMSFLRSACNNCKLRFDEQLLVFAQRPDATAVLEIERWNRVFGRRVNRGARGIAVFEDTDRINQRLNHYFDVSDTHAGEFSRPVPLWEMKGEYSQEVIDTLEGEFGELEDNTDLAYAVVSASQNAVEDNLPDYIDDLIADVPDSFLEGLDEQAITTMYKRLVTNSVAYMIMQRLGIETDELSADDFRDVVNFNTQSTVTALGIATSDIAEMGLTEISKTVMALDKQNRIIDKNRESDYNNGTNKTERSFENDRNNQLYKAGRLSASELETSRPTGGNFGQIRTDEEEVSEGASQNPLLQPTDTMQTDRTFGGHSAESQRNGRNADDEDGNSGRLDGGTESTGYDALGEQDEQPEEQSTRDSDVGSDIQLEWYDRDHEDKSLPFFGNDDTINEMLAASPHLKATHSEIKSFYESHTDNKKRTEYIKSIFNNDRTELTLVDGRKVGYKTMQNVLHIWEGSFEQKTSQGFYDWGVIAKQFEGMRLLVMLTDTVKPLPSIEGQFNILQEAGELKTPAFSFSQEIIDAVLTRGSNFSEGKMRIYEQFNKSLSANENIKFLKKEYGCGGSHPIITGTGISEDHDGKGIRLTRKNVGLDLSWQQVEKRIKNLIALDRYLNPKEKEYYPKWLEKIEQEHIEQAIEREKREALRTAPPDTEEVKEENTEYQYHLDDKVYIGSNEYEILSLGDETVTLYDTKFPLFNREMPITEFEEKVKENPFNDHLKVVVDNDKGDTTVIGKADSSGDKPIVEQYLELKKDVANELLIFQVGDFYEAMGDDAIKIANALNLTLLSRKADGTRVPMCGFPKIRLEAYTNMLIDRGFDVAIATDENEKAKVIASERKHKPINSHIIGRLDYYNADDNVVNSIEYTNPTSLRNDLINDIPFEKMGLVLYKDNDGNVVEHDYVDSLKNDLVKFEVIDYKQNLSEYDVLLDKAKDLINNFVNKEYERTDGADFSDLTNVEVAYTETEDGKYNIQAYINLENFTINTKADDMLVRTEQYASLQDIVDNALPYLEFGDLIYVDEDKLAEYEELHNEAEEYIDEYFNMVNDTTSGADYSDPTNIELENTKSYDGKHQLQSFVNLIDFNITIKVDGKIVRRETFETLSDMIESKLQNRDIPDFGFTENDLALFNGVGSKSLVEENADLIGKQIDLDDHIFEIERISSFGDVSLRDITFEEGVGIPISRVEKVGYVRKVLQLQEAEQNNLIPEFEDKPKPKAQGYDIHPDIPMAERHNFDLKNFELEEVGKKSRYKRNVEAIRVLKECEFDNRFSTPEEQKVLAQYVGWGGIPEAFDENNAAWADEFTELYGLLSPEEYAAAKESTLTAFYTPPAVTSAIYKALDRTGFKEGNLLEPSCGTGNFIGMLPDSMSEAKVYGVELDKISASIAQQLYQKASIAPQGFEEVTLPDSFFDGVIGNVPFGDFSVSDKKYDKFKFLIHDYFFAKSLDKLRPGGVMALVTSKGTMDKKNSSVRKYLAQRADLLGAIRLPNNTFKGNAGTEVVSDIIFLQKRDRLIDIEPEWVQTTTNENGREMNSYFVSHPDMVLGEWKTVSGRFGDEDTVVPYENSDLSTQLEEAITNINGQIGIYDTLENVELDEDNSIPADPTVRNFSYTVVDDKIYFRENSRMSPVDVSATAENRIKGMIKIREAVRELIEVQTEDYPDEVIKQSQERFNEVYDSFIKKYGLINSRANKSAFSDDSSYCLLAALEVINENGELERKADMFTKRTIKPHKPVTEVDTPSEALALSIGERASVDMEYMSQLCNKSEEEIIEDLKGVIFLNPLYDYAKDTEQKYLMADEYLSGNVREKLEVAKRSAKVYPDDYNVNVEALERVQPKDLSASEISVRLGSTWVPPEIVQQFMYEFLDTPMWARWKIKASYAPYTGEWNISNKSYDNNNVKAYNTYGTSRINAYKIIEETLNLKDVRIFDYIEDVDGKKKAVLNAKETSIAQAKQELIKQGFQDWIWSDPTRREKLTKLYNEKFNSTRPREYDGSHLVFSGMNPEIELREHQKNAVAHILYGGNTLLAHCVGAGKTFEMVAAAIESKRLGLCSKSLFVVPNHLTEQWAGEFLQLYPSAKILVATKKDFETANRKKFCGRIATGDYDAVIIGHSQFEKIPMSIERQRQILEKQIDDLIKGIATMKAQNGQNFSVKQMMKSKKTLETRLKKLNDQSRKDDVVTFEELGVDRLFVDESHYYKNLFLYTKMRNVGGIAQTEAQKSSDLFMKCRYLDELTNNRGTVFATGTPISNSMVELYTIQRYLQYDRLAEQGFENFDSWASTFGETITAIELTPEGKGYRPKTRFAKFFNLPELMNMVKEVMDIKTADMLDLPVPEAEYHNVAVKPSDVQKEMVASLAERAEKIRKGSVDPKVDNMLNITNDGRKLALDQRILNSMLPDFEGSKVNACVDTVFKHWEEGKDTKSTQLVFSDLSTPKDEDTFSVYYDIRNKLIERGIPAEEIRFIHEADTEAKKKELFKKIRRGDVRVLLGSTQKMGAGTNVQDLLIASHDLDVPWRPSDLEQRSGRIIRQGNKNDKVHIYRYVTEETFDAYSYQLIEGKQKFSSQIMTSKSPVRSAEDVDATALSYAEIKMLATGNPHFKEKMDLDIQVSKLKLLKSNSLSQKYDLEDKIIKYYPQKIAGLKSRIKGLEQDVETAKQHPKSNADNFSGMVVRGMHFDKKDEAGGAILNACKAMKSSDAVPLGEYRGFNMELSFDTFKRSYVVTVKGKTSKDVELGSDANGIITRIDNGIDKYVETLEYCKKGLENTEKQFETAKVEVEKPFAQEDELKTKSARLAELNAMLNTDKPDNEIIADEVGDGELLPEKIKSRDTESR